MLFNTVNEPIINSDNTIIITIGYTCIYNSEYQELKEKVFSMFPYYPYIKYRTGYLSKRIVVLISNAWIAEYYIPNITRNIEEYTED